MEKTYLTQDGYDKLIAEHEHLRTVRRREIADQISMARSHGDLRENAEYEAAKHAQQLNEIRIGELETKITSAVIINMENVSTDKVMIGTKVTLWDLKYEEEIEYQITGSDEADPDAGKISVNSPVAVAMLGRVIGDKIEVKAPRGVMMFEIRNISL
jgi:transcription elongation factor GreA